MNSGFCEQNVHMAHCYRAHASVVFRTSNSDLEEQARRRICSLDFHTSFAPNCDVCPRFSAKEDGLTLSYQATC
jgi:hypothetical protein